MCKSLRHRCLVNKSTTCYEHARNFTQRLLRVVDVVAGTEINYHIKFRVGKRQGSHVADTQLDRR